MKNYYSYIMAALTLATFGSCASDAMFPDPGFDLVTDKNITIRRDTCEKYDIKLNVTAPGGVDVIQILNGRTLEVVDEFTQFRGKENFPFEYEVDFEGIDENRDSVLMYNVRIVTLDKRGFNSTFRIDLRKLSFPEMTFPGSDIIGTLSPIITVVGHVNTGIYKIKSVKVFVEDVEMYSTPAEELDGLSEYDLSARIAYNFEQGRDYSLRIEVRDERDELRVWNMTVKGIELKKPTKLIIQVDDNEMALGEIGLTYDDQGRTTMIDCVIVPELVNKGPYWQYSWIAEFTYNEKGLVTKIAYRYIPSSSSNDFVYFEYDEQDRVKYIRLEQIHPTTGVLTVHDEMQNFKFRPDGTVLSFDRGITTVEDVYYVDGFVEGEKIFAQRWSNSFQYYAVGSVRYRADFVPILNPLWIEGMPPFWAPRTITREFSDMFWHKYIYTKDILSPRNTELDSSPNTYIGEYVYTTDENGQLSTFLRRTSTSGMGRFLYTFVY